MSCTPRNCTGARLDYCAHRRLTDAVGQEQPEIATRKDTKVLVEHWQVQPPDDEQDWRCNQECSHATQNQRHASLLCTSVQHWR
jgi:hypothetical protein